MLINFWDIDIAHYGSYSLYLQAIQRTDRLTHGLWEHVQQSPLHKDRTTMLVIPEVQITKQIAEALEAATNAASFTVISSPRTSGYGGWHG